MSYLKDKEKIQTFIEGAEEYVANIYKINKKDIRVRSRSKQHSQARFAVWYILVHINGLTSKEVARQYGYDHTTILHGVKTARILDIPTELQLDGISG